MAKSSQRKKFRAENEILQLTPEAYKELCAELENRINVVRREIAEELNVARELGDLSENHAYQVAMEKREMNENRIVELEGILAIAQVVEDNKSDYIVGLGDTVEIENQETKIRRIVTLVGTEDSMSANSLEGKISTDSPIGHAIFQAKLGDTVEVKLRDGVVKYKILSFKN